jgi:phage virion morphogenesis protein
MSAAAVRVEWQGLDTAQRVLSGLAIAGRNLFPLMDEIGGALETSTRVRFEDGDGPDGKRWTPSKRGGQTLVDTGRLLASITSNASRTSVEVGSNLIYAATHQFGRDAIPARPFLGLSVDDGREIEAIVEDYLRGAMSR